MISVSGPRYSPLLIFDMEDVFERDRGLRGKHPRPIGPLRLLLVAKAERGAAAAVALPSPMEMQVTENNSGFLVFFGSLVQSDGSVRKVSSGTGAWTVRVIADYYQSREVVIPLHPVSPAAHQDAEDASVTRVDLLPGPAYPFPDDPPGHAPVILRGTMHTASGNGLAGVKVTALKSNGESCPNPALTAADGQWVLTLPPAINENSVTVRFAMPNGSESQTEPVRVRSGRDNNISQTAIRGWVRKGNKGIAGAAVVLDPPKAKVLTDANGAWVFYFDMDQRAQKVSVTASLPNENAKMNATTEIRPQAMVAVPSFQF